MNSVILQGRLVKDPESRIINSENETKFARYTLAVSRLGKSEKQNADFLNCICFGSCADFAENYLKQGTQILIKGVLQSNSYVDKNGNKVYTTDIKVLEHYFSDSN